MYMYTYVPTYIYMYSSNIKNIIYHIYDVLYIYYVLYYLYCMIIYM
jgi:hypothetical protein